MLPDAVQVADPFHLVKLANHKLDECRRRVSNETIGHRGRSDDPLYRARRLLTKAHERLDQAGDTKLRGLLRAGDPRGEVQMTWHTNFSNYRIRALLRRQTQLEPTRHHHTPLNAECHKSSTRRCRRRPA